MKTICQACGATIIWVGVKDRSPIAINPTPLTEKEKAKADTIVMIDGEAYQPHTETCPECRKKWGK